MATNPNISQGTLNRVRASIIVSAFPSLNILSSYMGKNFVSLHPDGPWVQQIETGTGIVTSPEPYIMFNIAVGILRSQPLADAWLAQAEATVYLGTVTVHSDTSAFPARKFRDVSITHYDPGVFDGADPVVALTLRGKFNINNNLWNL